MSTLAHSVFHTVFFPSKPVLTGPQANDGETLLLTRSVRFNLTPATDVLALPLVVFDLETTGLDSENDRIIEIGAIKINAHGDVLGEMSTLIATDRKLTPKIQQITGINDAMLVGKPAIEPIIRQFLKFIEGSVLVAHNAEFDLGFIKAACRRQGVVIEWPTFCTLKLARQLLPNLERKNLDTLAAHYGLQFEARHRSIGDVKVTIAVLRELLGNEGSHLSRWSDFAQFAVQ
jgi:DNA polymerase-3 subunit epsilon